MDDIEFCQTLFSTQHITVMPGTFLGRQDQGLNPGKGHARVAWVAPLEECIEAAERLVDFVKS